MSLRAQPKPDTLTSAQRRDEIAAILARAIVRLHQRSALHKQPTAQVDEQIQLDSGAEIPLSVSKRPTPRLTPTRPSRDAGNQSCPRN